MKRLLCLLSGMNAGGAETFLMKIYRNIDRTQFQFDFCINVSEKCFYEDEIFSMGGKIYRIPCKSEGLKKFTKQLGAIIKDNRYEYVIRITSNAMGFFDLKIAKKAGARVCCARSSNSSDGASLKSKIVHRIGRMMYQRYVDISIAPSDLAAKYTFGEKAYSSGSVSILHNAVDLGIFHFDEKCRNDVRIEFGMPSDAVIIGHIGRFMEQKNHMFLTDVFKCIHDVVPNARLLLVGTGSLKDDLEKKVQSMGIGEYVIFAGVRFDIPRLLSAMDVFVMPSLFEGMPNAVIEAQATGLPCVIADTITREANITGLVRYLPLDNPQMWAERVLDSISEQRVDTKQTFVERGYDIESTVRNFVKLVFGEE